MFLSATLNDVTDSFTSVPTVKSPSILKSPVIRWLPVTSKSYAGVCVKNPIFLVLASKYWAV